VTCAAAIAKRKKSTAKRVQAGPVGLLQRVLL